MDAEQSIAEIEWLERILTVPDTRPLSAGDLSAANRRHDDMHQNRAPLELFELCGLYSNEVWRRKKPASCVNHWTYMMAGSQRPLLNYGCIQSLGTGFLRLAPHFLQRINQS